MTLSSTDTLFFRGWHCTESLEEFVDYLRANPGVRDLCVICDDAEFLRDLRSWASTYRAQIVRLTMASGVYTATLRLRPEAHCLLFRPQPVFSHPETKSMLDCRGMSSVDSSWAIANALRTLECAQNNRAQTDELTVLADQDTFPQAIRAWSGRLGAKLRGLTFTAGTYRARLALA